MAPLGAFNAMEAAASLPAAPFAGATRIVALTNCVQREELGDDSEYAEIFADMQVRYYVA